ADWLYGDVGKREFGDIDLLIDRESFQLALQLLSKAGYKPDSYRSFLLESAARTEAFFRTDYHIPLENTSSATSSMVEAHWEVAYPRLHFQFPSSEWKQFHQEYQIRNIRIDAFTNEYQFLLLVVHHGGKEQWSRLKYIADFAAFMTRWGCTIDWNLTANLAREKGIYTLLVQSLGLLKALGLPWKDAWQIKPEEVDTASFVKTWEEMPPAASNSSWPYFVHGMSVHDGIVHKSKVLFKHLKYLTEVNLLIDKARWYKRNPTSDVL
ncbi:MAG TPA: nucleotidyltransferase family protein, partial [Dyadobacter sp.]|nr:nucleotidyltransferase family protein [Dyadobacter sp.]